MFQFSFLELKPLQCLSPRVGVVMEKIQCNLSPDTVPDSYLTFTG